MDNPVIKFTGLNNKLRPSEFPISPNGTEYGRCWKAIDVNFSNTGEVLLPCQGSTSVYSGDVTSLFVGDNGTLFVEGGSLYLLDDPPVELVGSVGANVFYYTEVGNVIYFSNGTVRGRYVKGESASREWGTAVPTQPTCTPITTGGMTAGDYRVAITWIAGDESGTGNSVRVTVVEGGGIALSDFPAAPSYVTHVAVWLSHCNGKDLYLYGEYVIATTSLNLVKKLGTIPLETQFGYPPTPTATLVSHFGRIYYASGSLVYYTHIGANGPRYGLQMGFHFFPFDSDVQTIVSTPGVLYVGTLTRQYKIDNIDGDLPIAEEVRETGSVKGSECYDPDGNAYLMTNRGFMKATPEGLQELSYDNVAIPFYTYGTTTITEVDGIKYLHFFGTGETKNPLANAEWNTADSTGTGWAINLSTGAVNKYENVSFNNVSNGYGCSATGIGLFSGRAAVVGTVETGKHDFKSSKEKRISDAYVLVEGGKTTLTVTSDGLAIPYQLREPSIQENVKVNLARGAKGRYWQFKLNNRIGHTATVTELEPIVIMTPRY